MKFAIYQSSKVFLFCLLFVFIAGNIWAIDDDASRLLYLPFDGDDPEDLSQYAHEVELVGNPEHVDGKYGMAYEVSTSNYIKVPITETLQQLTEQFTVVFWVKKGDPQPGTWNYMVAGGSLKWAVILNADQKVYIYSANPNWSHRMTTDDILPEEWTHIAMVYDVDSGVEVYFNGELAGSGAQPAAVVDVDGSIMVGARHPGQEFFAGIIDEVALYNRILTQDEIMRDMEAVGGAAVSASGKLASSWGEIKGN
ncbi:hypothetical protein GF312_22040 [Candidatus Poribacteria bacterium]|nr:hypothetical protein [Candidatus Poribacteria bacterium]